MQLTIFTDTSLRTLMYLGIKENEIITLNEISTVYDVSINHLKKIAWELNKSGYIDSVNGRNGGYKLAQSPEYIQIGNIIRKYENLELVTCMKKDGFCALEPACKLKRALQEALDAYLNVLDQYTLSDLLTNQDELVEALFSDYKMKAIQH
ncbi:MULTISPECIES: Rrf2 family transcriptional regulator [Shouchella]|uniref:HTH-type transcriptional regulator NsrR n=3 Tax=Bacillaceae TaxID=186817 RepID=A0A060LPE5_9BACI|nr:MULTISPECIES: Rrf2 family transcriptional regulator [Bacillaceae]AIC93191.1 nsrR-like HTH-type transcriptional regulator [Shouchella lehensis G1]KQL55987.1 hypothetical protein AN965_15530 [Alkalicoccobacillus plakortidis]MBG9783044.1 hypothetical protein [Shouchella lehensis]TES49600.1 Rrf2 family transcriptional regulator [Shouchella lehensis]